MTLDEIKKALSEKGVDASIVSAISALDNSSEVERLTSELTAERGKNAQIVADKNKYKQERDDARSSLESAKNENLSVDEKWQKQIDDAKSETQKLRDELESEKKHVAAEKREAEIAKLAGEIKPVNGVSAQTINLLVKNALTEIEDLSDADKVTEAINAIKDANKAIIAADVPEGSGNKHEHKAIGGDDKPATMKDLMADVWGDK